MPVIQRLDIVDLVSIGTATAVVVVLVVSLALALRPHRRRPLSERQYNAELFKRRMALEELSYPLLNEVRIRAGKGKVLKLDQVIRLPSSVLLVTSAPSDVAGQVMVNSRAGQWRYINGQGTVGTMPNPVVSLRPLIHAIRSRFPLVRIRLLTVFPQTADFRGRPPRGCCHADGVVAAVRAMAADDGPASEAMEEAWDPLSMALRDAGGAPAA